MSFYIVLIGALLIASMRGTIAESNNAHQDDTNSRKRRVTEIKDNNSYQDDTISRKQHVENAKDYNSYQDDVDPRERDKHHVVESKIPELALKRKSPQLAAQTNILKAPKESEPHFNTSFSGVYEPDILRGLDIYAGAWLASTKLFQELRPRLDTIADLEGASFFIVDQSCLNKRTFYIEKPTEEMCVILRRTRTVLTRDYFDFQVEHMSSTTKYLEPVNYYLLLPNLRRNANMIAHLGSYKTERNTRLAKYTLAIIPVSVNPVQQHRKPELYEVATRVRFNMFKATFWSIYRHIPRIIVSYTNAIGKQWIERFRDYIWMAIDLSAHADEPLLQPKRTLQHVSDLLRNDSKLATQIKYIYYSEADEILHMRQSDRILDVIDNGKGSFVFTPHRLESYFLPQSLEPKQRKKLKKYNFMKISSLRYHANTSLLELEAGGASIGSCCDAGRRDFPWAPDGGRWMFAPEWGLRNVSTWVKFGRFGISMPLLSESKAVCDYSPTTIVCPTPPYCKRRVPTGSDVSSVCWEIRRDYSIEQANAVPAVVKPNSQSQQHPEPAATKQQPQQAVELYSDPKSAVYSNLTFSGVYEPDLSRGFVFAGAWLASVELFQKLRPRLDTITDLTGASFFLADDTCNKLTLIVDKAAEAMCLILRRTRSVVTRDYYDFHIEHLSSAMKYLEPSNYPLLLSNLKKNANMLYNLGYHATGKNTRLSKYSVAVITFVTPLKQHFRQLELYEVAVRARFNMFKATFWSIYKHIPRIVVSYTDPIGKQWKERFRDYIWKAIDLSALAGKPQLQPKRTLQYVSDLLRNDSKLATQIKYIYYSEADEILHMRQSDRILDVIDNGKGSFVFTPHRLEPYVLPQSLELKQQKELNDYRFMKTTSLQYHANTSLIVLESEGTTGSCCDAGRMEFPPLKSGLDWMFAEQWGLRNISTWVKFGKYGLSIPMITEHKGTCQYSSTRVVCPMSSTSAQCRRTPNGAELSSVCSEIPPRQSSN